MSAEVVSIMIRKARISDAPAIGRVYVRTWRSAYAGVVPDKILVGMSEVNQAGNWHRQIDRTKDKSHGDFATNIALMLAKPAGMKPRDLAEKLISIAPVPMTVESLGHDVLKHPALREREFPIAQLAPQPLNA